jgi:hypothetical protein
MQIYKCFKFNKQKGQAQHNKNYDGEIITPSPKKWNSDHRQ